MIERGAGIQIAVTQMNIAKFRTVYALVSAFIILIGVIIGNVAGPGETNFILFSAVVCTLGIVGVVRAFVGNVKESERLNRIVIDWGNSSEVEKEFARFRLLTDRKVYFDWSKVWLVLTPSPLKIALDFSTTKMIVAFITAFLLIPRAVTEYYELIFFGLAATVYVILLNPFRKYVVENGQVSEWWGPFKVKSADLANIRYYWIGRSRDDSDLHFILCDGEKFSVSAGFGYARLLSLLKKHGKIRNTEKLPYPLEFYDRLLDVKKTVIGGNP